MLKRKLIILIVFFFGIASLAAIPKKEKVKNLENSQIQVQEEISLSGFHTSPSSHQNMIHTPRAESDIPTLGIFIAYATAGILLLVVIRLKNHSSDRNHSLERNDDLYKNEKDI